MFLAWFGGKVLIGDVSMDFELKMPGLGRRKSLRLCVFLVVYKPVGRAF